MLSLSLNLIHILKALLLVRCGAPYGLEHELLLVVLLLDAEILQGGPAPIPQFSHTLLRCALITANNILYIPGMPGLILVFLFDACECVFGLGHCLGRQGRIGVEFEVLVVEGLNILRLLLHNTIILLVLKKFKWLFLMLRPKILLLRRQRKIKLPALNFSRSCATVQALLVAIKVALGSQSRALSLYIEVGCLLVDAYMLNTLVFHAQQLRMRSPNHGGFRVRSNRVSQLLILIKIYLLQ